MKAARACLFVLLALPFVSAPAWAQKVDAIQEEGDYYILNFSENPDETVSLEQFVNICQEATGRNFTYGDTTRTSLATGKVFIYGTKRVPKRDFYAFFQILMFINDYVCVEVGPPHISVVLIQSLQGNRGGQNLRQKTIHVLPDDLPDFADQPATLITTVLSLPNVDVRQLTTTMRGLLTDTNTQSILSAGEHSVIIQGFGSYVASLAQLLYLVDKESAIPDEIPPVFAVLPLAYAAAEDVADLIERLTEDNSRPRGGLPQQGASGSLRAGTNFETKILVDSRTESLLVMALPDEMPRIKDLVARLDVEVLEPERNFHIYNLQNVIAEDLAETLDEFLSDSERLTQGRGTTGGRPGAQGGAPSSQDNQVVVVPETKTNSLLIAANKTRYEEVLELIRQLDRRQDQVLIETALIELSGTDFRDIGIELAFADVLGDGGFGVSNFGLSTLTDTDGDGIPDTRTPNLGEGLVAGILDGDNVNMPLLLAAVKRTDGANVLNVPSILVNNNDTARVETLDEQPFESANFAGNNGAQQNTFGGYEEAGITLEISPTISASRFLRLNVTLEVSTFRGTGSSTTPPPRITRSLRTVVNVPDGDTMVIGGIITDDLAETSTKIPILGDIPILGRLFRRDTNTNSRTTLYFFVTPHIMRDRDFADLAEISYRKKLEAAEIIGRDRIQVIDPSFGRRDDDFEFESFLLPLYDSPTRGEIDAEAVGLTPEKRAELMRQKTSSTSGAGTGASSGN